MKIEEIVVAVEVVAAVVVGADVPPNCSRAPMLAEGICVVVPRI